MAEHTFCKLWKCRPDRMSAEQACNPERLQTSNSSEHFMGMRSQAEHFPRLHSYQGGEIQQIALHSHSRPPPSTQNMSGSHSWPEYFNLTLSQPWHTEGPEDAWLPTVATVLQFSFPNCIESWLCYYPHKDRSWSRYSISLAFKPVAEIAWESYVR